MPTLSLNEWIKLLGEFYDQYGYLVVFLGTLGENTALLGLLLPGNSLALLGAAYARLGTLNLGWVVLFASLGTILGYHIAKHGGKAILMSHLIGHLRSFVALSAGMTRMKYLRFLGYELVAAALWNTTFCLLGYLLAAEVDRLQVLIERAGWVLLGVLVLLFLAWRFFRQRIRHRMQQKRWEARRRARSAVLQ